MGMHLKEGDLCRCQVDAIVNAANRTLLGGGGVDGAIHRAAGPELVKECALLGGCETGEAKVTRGYQLAARYVIHTVGPVWRGGTHGEAELLRNCYVNSLKRAVERGCKSVAFPAISTGVYRYPVEEASALAVGSVREFLIQHPELEVFFVCFDSRTLSVYKKLLQA